MPAYLLFWSGHSLNDPDTMKESFGFKTGLASLSLANLGEKTTNTLKLALTETHHTVNLFCNNGVIGAL